MYIIILVLVIFITVDLKYLKHILKMGINNDNPKSAINLAKTICTEGQKLSEQFPGIVLLIFIPNSWSNYRQFNYHGETFDLHNYIKAFAAQHRFTTQFIEEKTLYDKMVCEISWWLSLALFVKALRTPWTLADLDQIQHMQELDIA